jgi:hypothetical protein
VVGSHCALENRQGALVDARGFFQLTLVPQDDGQVVERGSQLKVFRALDPLLDGERLPTELFSFYTRALPLKNRG